MLDSRWGGAAGRESETRTKGALRGPAGGRNQIETDPPDSKSEETLAYLSVSRPAILTRALAWGAPAGLMALAVREIFMRIGFRPSGLPRGPVDFSLCVVLLPLAGAVLFFGGRAISWLLLAFWPAPVGVWATAEALVTRFGPWGRRRYRADELDIRYGFEWPEEQRTEFFEAMLPEEEQLASYLPRIRHPSAVTPVNQTMLRFLGRPEFEVAAAMRSALERWRERNPQDRDTTNDREADHTR